MSNKPGGFSSLFAILGIITYAIGSIFSINVIQLLIEEPQSLEEGIGNILVSLILLGFAILATAVATLFTLIGQIWKQRPLIALLSFLAYLPNVVAIVFLFSPGLSSITIEAIVFFGVYLAVAMLHIRGIASGK